MSPGTTQTESTVYLPSLGEAVDEATVTRWLKRPGDTVEREEPLLEVATDKVDTEIPSPFTGTIAEILAEENDVVAVGAALAVVSIPNAEGPVATVDASPEPAVRESIAPVAPIASTVPAPPTVAAVTPAAALTPPAPALPSPGTAESVTEKLPPIRRTIARRMVESLQISAQLTTVVEVDLSAISHLRSAHKDDFLNRTGTKLSYLPFFAKATMDALPAHPMINASLNDDVTEVTYHRPCHLGIAVEGPKGLMVPVIRDADKLSIAGLACAIAASADKVRAGAITVDELNGGTFTITNTGSRGALFDTPIINQPQSAILGTGAVVERVVPIRADDSALRIEVRPLAFLSISYDHRIVDGADAAKFLTAVKARLETGYSAADLAD